MTTPLKAVAAGGNSAELREWAAGDFLPVALGGTGGTTAAAARSNLGLGSAAVAAIVGTVSQSGGVPTGAIIQRGSNANGEFVRLADGTQWCWREFAGTITTSTGYLSGFISTQHNLPFPATFVSAPDTHMQLIYAAAPAPLQVYVAALDVNNWANHWYSATNGNVNARAFFTAKGRWYS